MLKINLIKPFNTQKDRTQYTRVLKKHRSLIRVYTHLSSDPRNVTEMSHSFRRKIVYLCTQCDRFVTSFQNKITRKRLKIFR